MQYSMMGLCLCLNVYDIWQILQSIAVFILRIKRTWDREKMNEMMKCIDKLESSGDYRVIKRFVPVAHYNHSAPDDIKLGIYLDTETTGINSATNEIIELAMVPFEFDSSGKIYRVLPEYNSFQDPHKSIDEIITRVTGITDDMVRGQSIDLGQVSAMLKKAVIVIAHNARFDRAFVEKLSDDFKDISWGCSISDINWDDEGIGGVKLDYLAYKYGFFYDAHRATIDCQAGIEILSRNLPESGEPVLKRLLDSARRIDVRLWAENAPFDKKDILKERGYRWSSGHDGKPKAWYCDIHEENLADETRYLKEKIYPRDVGDLKVDRITAKQRYSNRV